jgi:hypothetical protein
VQFYTGCELGCSDAREAVGALRYPLLVLWLGLAALGVVRVSLWVRRP